MAKVKPLEERNPIPTTEISDFDEYGANIRGKSLTDDIIGELTFTEMIYFYIMGEVPTAGQARILDAVLVTLVDHGILGGLAPRFVYMGSPDHIQGAVAAGVLAMGNQFGGTMENCGALLEEIINDPAGIEAAAASKVKEYAEWEASSTSKPEVGGITKKLSKGKLIPGMGHPHFRPEDLRATKLIQTAEREDVPGKHIQAIHAIQKSLSEQKGRFVTINATGGIAVCLGEIGIPWRIMRGFPTISRAAGVVGQILEEQRKPAGYYVAMKVQNEVLPYTGKPYKVRMVSKHTA